MTQNALNKKMYEYISDRMELNVKICVFKQIKIMLIFISRLELIYYL